MSFMDQLRKLTQPIDDENDFFEDADIKFKPQPTVSEAQAEFENTFGDEPASSPEPAVRKQPTAPWKIPGWACTFWRSPW